MHILPTILSLILLNPSTATPLKHALRPWQISKLSTFSPSGRPGSSPWSTINATITDPNTHPDHTALLPSTAICTTKWESYGAAPYNLVNTCTNSEASDQSLWTFEMLESVNSTYPSPTTDFVLRFTRKVEVDAPAGHDPHEVGVNIVSFVGSARFAVGAEENMRGVCGASGVCSWGLREEKTPFYVDQTRLNS